MSRFHLKAWGKACLIPFVGAGLEEVCLNLQSADGVPDLRGCPKVKKLELKGFRGIESLSEEFLEDLSKL